MRDKTAGGGKGVVEVEDVDVRKTRGRGSEQVKSLLFTCRCATALQVAMAGGAEV